MHKVALAIQYLSSKMDRIWLRSFIAIILIISVTCKAVDKAQDKQANEIVDAVLPAVSTSEKYENTTMVDNTTEGDSEKMTTESIGTTTTTEPTTREPEQCSADVYCDGEVLPAKLVLNNTFVMCDQAILPKDRCCLPNGPHLVCYNIMADGQRLNYDVAVGQLSTDITGLCQAIVASQKKKQGQYTAASIENGQGMLVYNFGTWSATNNNNAKNPQHIKDLACEISKN